MSPEETTVEVSLTDEELARLKAVADDPAELLHDAGMDRVLLEEAIAATVDDGSASARSDESDPSSAGEAGPETPIAPVGLLLGFEPVSMGDGEATIEMEAGPEHANPMGTLHGGVVCDLADAAMGTAYATSLDEGESFTTLELGVNFLRPVWDDRLTATASVVSEGRTVGLVECDVTNPDGKLVARLSSTCLTLRGDDAAGR
jgi:uncharacterized protein (TIGR00369 family)